MQTRYKRALAAALVLLFSTHAAAAKDAWTGVRSQHFFLVGNAPEREIRQVATRLEQFREVFTKLFDKVNFNAPVPTTVVVFKSDSAYKLQREGRRPAHLRPAQGRDALRRHLPRRPGRARQNRRLPRRAGVRPRRLSAEAVRKGFGFWVLGVG